MITVKPLPFVLAIALVLQGLFFSVDASENLKTEASLAGDVRVHFERARQYAERGLVDLAIPELERVIKLCPDDAAVHAYLGWAYGQKGLISEAVQAFQSAVQLNPDLQTTPFDYPMSNQFLNSQRVLKA